MIQNEYGTLICPKCGYTAFARFGCGMPGCPGEHTLCADIAAGRKGEEAKAGVWIPSLNGTYPHTQFPHRRPSGRHKRLVFLLTNDMSVSIMKLLNSGCISALSETFMV